jgi:hypothetical protein
MSWGWDCEKTHAGITEIPAAGNDRYSNDAQTGREVPGHGFSASVVVAEQDRHGPTLDLD